MLNETSNGLIQAHYMSGPMEGFGHHGIGMMHGPFSFIAFIAFIFLAIWLFRRFALGKSGCGHGDKSSALSILNERFVKGEIDEAEFRAKRDVLKLKD